MSVDAATALASLRDWRVIDLSQTYRPGMYQSKAATPYQHHLVRRHGDAVRPDGSSSATDLLISGTHVGTHIDAFSHYSHEGRLHGGVDAVEAQAAGFPDHDVRSITPIVGRGIMLDVPAALGIEACPAAYEITPGDLDAAVRRQGTVPQHGDVLFVRSGWWLVAASQGRGADGVPGVAEAGSYWLADHQPRAVGADTGGFELLPPSADVRTPLPAHRIFLYERGINMIENVELEELASDELYEFVVVVAPMPLEGATAGPVRPLALVPRDGSPRPSA